MEPLRTIVDDGEINSKFNDVFYSSRMLTIPLIRCDDQIENIIIKQQSIDDQVLNEVIKEEITDETDHHNDSRLLQNSNELNLHFSSKMEVLPIKEEVIIEELNSDIRTELFPIGSRTIPLIRCDDQIENVIIKQESIDDQVLNEVIKEEITDETDHHNDSRLLQNSNELNLHFSSKMEVLPIKEEVIIEELNSDIRTELFPIGITTEENENPIDSAIKIEVDVLGSYKFEGIVSIERNTTEVNICRNSNLTSAKSPMTIHIRTRIAEKQHKCDICDRAFSKKHNLSRHKIIHTGEKPVKCDICDRVFSRKSYLIRHKIIHTGVIPMKCDICDIVLSQKSSLIRHIRTHTGERPHKCDICHRAFSEKHHLKKHKLIHTGERPHKCDMCGRAFSMKQHLSFHKKTHTGEKPHKCDTCNRVFSRKSSLIRHLRTHTGEKPYKCEVCGHAFSLKQALSKHIKSIHSNTV